MYRQSARVVAKVAPPTPWYRLAWAWCRGVIGRWAIRAEDHAALGDLQGPARRWRMRRDAARDYPLDRPEALKAEAYNARGPDKPHPRGVPWVPMAMPGTRIRE